MNPELLQEIDQLIAEIEDSLGKLQDGLNRILGMIPGWADWVADRIREGWDTLCTYMAHVWEVLTAPLRAMGAPLALWSAVDRWTSDVGGPVSGEVLTADAGSLRSDDAWSGDAADRYRQTLPQQKAALTAIKSTFADAAGKGLGSVATAIVVFWGLLATGLAALAGGILGAIASTATVLGAPAGPVIAVAAALAFVALAGGGVANLVSQASTANADMARALNDATAFPGRRWPVAAI